MEGNNIFSIIAFLEGFVLCPGFDFAFAFKESKRFFLSPVQDKGYGYIIGGEKAAIRGKQRIFNSFPCVTIAAALLPDGFGYIFPFHKVLIPVNKIAVFI